MKAEVQLVVQLCCVTLAKLLALSGPWISQLENVVEKRHKKREAFLSFYNFTYAFTFVMFQWRKLQACFPGYPSTMALQLQSPSRLDI